MRFAQVVEASIGQGHLDFLADLEAVDMLAHQSALGELRGKREVDLDQ